MIAADPSVQIRRPSADVREEQGKQDSVHRFVLKRRGEETSFGLALALSPMRARVTGVDDGSAAARAGLQPLDEITAVDGEPTNGTCIAEQTRGHTEVIVQVARPRVERLSSVAAAESLKEWSEWEKAVVACLLGDVDALLDALQGLDDARGHVASAPARRVAPLESAAIKCTWGLTVTVGATLADLAAANAPPESQVALLSLLEAEAEADAAAVEVLEEEEEEAVAFTTQRTSDGSIGSGHMCSGSGCACSGGDCSAGGGGGGNADTQSSSKHSPPLLDEVDELGSPKSPISPLRAPTLSWRSSEGSSEWGSERRSSVAASEPEEEEEEQQQQEEEQQEEAIEDYYVVAPQSSTLFSSSPGSSSFRRAVISGHDGDTRTGSALT